MKILVFGNPLVEKDSLALRIAKKLEKEFPQIEFKEFDPIENLEKEGKNLTILDVGEGISKVEVIDDLEKLENKKIFSMHDFDLSYELKLLKELGLIEKVKIIAIPFNLDENEAFEEVREIISSLFSKSD